MNPDLSIVSLPMGGQLDTTPVPDPCSVNGNKSPEEGSRGCKAGEREAQALHTQARGTLSTRVLSRRWTWGTRSCYPW